MKNFYSCFPLRAGESRKPLLIARFVSDQFVSSRVFSAWACPEMVVYTAVVNLNNEELSLFRAKKLVKSASGAAANSLGVTTPQTGRG
jgi:hypothetical protein